MAGEIHGQFEYAPKGYTRGTDIGKGQLSMKHMSPALFLELRLIKTHTHTSVDSLPLRAEATPEMVRGFKTREREERGTAQWTGGLSSGGGLTLTYGTAFQEVPTVLLSISSGDPDADVQVTYNNKTTSSVDIYWKDDTGAGHTIIYIDYLIKGR